MPKSMSLIAIVLDTCRRLWRLASNRIMGRGLEREKPHVEVPDPPLDFHQAGEQGRMAWFELVRQGAPHLLAHTRLNAQLGRDATMGSQPTPPKHLPVQEEPMIPVAQAETPRPERTGIWSWLSCNSVPASGVAVLPSDRVESQGVSPRNGTKSPLPFAKEPISASLRLRRKVNKPRFTKEAAVHPSKSTGPESRPWRQSPQIFESTRTPPEPLPVVQRETKPTVRSLKQSPSMDCNSSSANAAVREQSLPVIPGHDKEAVRRFEAPTDPWPTQRRMHQEPQETYLAPDAQASRWDVETGKFWVRESVPKVTSAPLGMPEEKSWKVGESIAEAAPLSSPRERWPSLLPDRQPDAATAPSFFWRDAERRLRLRGEQRGM